MSAPKDNYIRELLANETKQSLAELTYGFLENASKLEAENAELRKVLAWYGDGGRYDFQNTYSMTSEINKDRGKRAREVQRQGVSDEGRLIPHHGSGP